MSIEIPSYFANNAFGARNLSPLIFHAASQVAEKLRFGEGYGLRPVRNLFIISTGLYRLRKNSKF
jgi:hypothetical protein